MITGVDTQTLSRRSAISHAHIDHDDLRRKLHRPAAGARPAWVPTPDPAPAALPLRPRRLVRQVTMSTGDQYWVVVVAGADGEIKEMMFDTRQEAERYIAQRDADA